VARDIEARCSVSRCPRIPRRGAWRVRGAPGEPAPALSAGPALARGHRARAACRLQSSRLTLLVLTSLPSPWWEAWPARSCRAASCRWDRWSGSSRCSASPRATHHAVSHFRHLHDAEGCRSAANSSCALRGSARADPDDGARNSTRTRADCGGGNRPGHEIEHPMAVVILGGLVTSTVLNLFLMPSLYLRYGRRRGVAAGRAWGARRGAAGPIRARAVSTCVRPWQQSGGGGRPQEPAAYSCSSASGSASTRRGWRTARQPASTMSLDERASGRPSCSRKQRLVPGLRSARKVVGVIEGHRHGASLTSRRHFRLELQRDAFVRWMRTSSRFGSTSPRRPADTVAAVAVELDGDLGHACGQPLAGPQVERHARERQL